MREFGCEVVGAQAGVCLCHLGVIRFVGWLDILLRDFGEGWR